MKKLIGTAIFALTLVSTHALSQRSDASLPECNVDQGEQICDVLFRRLNKLQKKGSPEAATLLALFYLSGEFGLPKDPEKGVKLLERAARKRSAVAQYELAKRYLLGEDVEQDQARAMVLMKKAANSKYADAIVIYNMIMLEQAQTEEEKAEHLAALNTVEFGALNDGDYFLGKYFKHLNHQEQAQKYLAMAAKRGHRKAREMMLDTYPQMQVSTPEVFDDKIERIEVVGVRPDVNAAAREVIDYALKQQPAYRGRSTGSRLPGNRCDYDWSCNMLDRDFHANFEFRLLMLMSSF